MIWYRVEVRFHKPPQSPTRGFPSYIKATWAGYFENRKERRWEKNRRPAWNSFEAKPAPPDPSKKLRINHDSIDKIRRRLRETPEFARVIVNNRSYRDFNGIKKAFERHERGKPEIQKFKKLDQRLKAISQLIDADLIVFTKE